jgi:hypothetical protein
LSTAAATFYSITYHSSGHKRGFANKKKKKDLFMQLGSCLCKLPFRPCKLLTSLACSLVHPLRASIPPMQVGNMLRYEVAANSTRTHWFAALFQSLNNLSIHGQGRREDGNFMIWPYDITIQTTCFLHSPVKTIAKLHEHQTLETAQDTSSPSERTTGIAP